MRIARGSKILENLANFKHFKNVTKKEVSLIKF